MREREEKIRQARLRQPIEELARKAATARGRHTNQYWSQEELDLADAEAKDLFNYLNGTSGQGERDG
jgi:hypothetical protein